MPDTTNRDTSTNTTASTSSSGTSSSTQQGTTFTSGQPQQNTASPEVMAAYPARYYAQYDLTVKDGPAPIKAWFDMWAYQDVSSGYPPAEDMFPLTEAFWQDHISSTQTPRAIENGKVVSYTPPPIPVPLNKQAQSLIVQARTKFTDLQMQGKTFGPNMQKYMSIISSIADGTDTTTTELPIPPSDPTT